MRMRIPVSRSVMVGNCRRGRGAEQQAVSQHSAVKPSKKYTVPIQHPSASRSQAPPRRGQDVPKAPESTQNIGVPERNFACKGLCVSHVFYRRPRHCRDPRKKTLQRAGESVSNIAKMLFGDAFRPSFPGVFARVFEVAESTFYSGNMPIHGYAKGYSGKTAFSRRNA